MKIVVVEDDPLQAELAHDQLLACFHKVEVPILTSETEFFEQLAALKAAPPTALVIDMFISGPGTDFAGSGLRCLKAILESTELASLPVVIRSALSESEVRRCIGETPINVVIVRKADESWTFALRSLLLATRPEEIVPSSGDVFIVHGHDHGAKEMVARLIEKLGGRAIILHEQVNSGSTIIEKFEKHSNASFAIVLITPDDIGGKSAMGLKPRARQNAIFEMGFFYAKLGRQRVCSLRKEGVEFPSDIHGILDIEMDKAGAWRLALMREFRAAKLPFNFDLALT